MGNTNSSQSNQQPQTAPTNIDQAVLSGNQLLVAKEVRDKLSEISSIIQTYGKSDYHALMKEIDKMNESLSGNKFTIPEDVKKSMLEFHKAIIYKIDKNGSYSSKEEKQRAANAAANNFESDLYKQSTNQINSPDILNYLESYYQDDVKSQFDKIIATPGIKDNKVLVDNLSTIVKTLSVLRAKYRFFEYKYIQMNIFLLMFVQHSYSSIDKFIDNVLEFNQKRDSIREQTLRNTLDAMIGIVNASDINVDPKEFTALNKMLDDISAEMRAKQAATKEELDRMAQQPKLELQQTLKAMELSASSPGTTLQNGGFIRAQTTSPQSFYEL
jgi:hypothetical protein